MWCRGTQIYYYGTIPYVVHYVCLPVSYWHVTREWKSIRRSNLVEMFPIVQETRYVIKLNMNRSTLKILKSASVENNNYSAPYGNYV